MWRCYLCKLRDARKLLRDPTRLSRNIKYLIGREADRYCGPEILAQGSCLSSTKKYPQTRGAELVVDESMRSRS